MVFGIFVGLLVAFGVYRINSSIKSRVAAPQDTPIPGTNNSDFKIALDKPESGDVFTQDSVVVSGLTKALAWIVISGEQGDYIIQSDEGGVFSQDVNLASGVNQIKVTALDPAGTKSAQKVIVIYSSAFQEKTFASTPPEASGDSAIRDKVAQKVAEALNKPKAYLGTVTDITDSTIQIKTLESEIKQVSTAEEGISVVNAKGTSNKAVKLTDIAIGDFIVAMGYINSKSVLLAQRILITDPVTDPKINVNLSSMSEITIKPDKKTLAYSFSDGKTVKVKVSSIKDDDQVIYITNSSLRTIFVVDNKSS